MTSHDPDAKTADIEAEEERQIARQFTGFDNDLVQVEAADGKPEPRDDALSDADVDETGAGGLRDPAGVRTSRPETDR